MKTKRYGLKLLREDNGSLRDEGRLFYPEGAITEAPADTPGIFLSVSDGLTLGGWGPVIAVMEFTKRDILGKNSGIVRVKKARRLTTQEVAALPGGCVGEHRVTIHEGKAALVSVNGNLHVPDAETDAFPVLTHVGGDLDALYAHAGAFPVLTHVGGYLDAIGAQAGAFPALERIDKFLDARGARAGTFPALESVGEDLYAPDAEAGAFPVLETVGGYLCTRGAHTGAFPRLKK